ncbi:MAG: class I SAM-dependent methyltransferase [bacterium]|nr:class I SAM-dependent methyltransferase [bacterium]
MKIKEKNAPCPLCGSSDIDAFFEDKKRVYRRCSFCKLVFVPERCHLSAADEKAEYDLHENDAQDQGYRKFLSRLSRPLLEKLDANQKGLDFGCGPGPALSVMLEEHGHQVDIYDPFYYNDPLVYNKKYDFICATEVAEHLREPNKEFTALFQMLKQGAWLGIMTKMVIHKQAFSTWRYAHDMTHICFYSRSTFEYIANRFNSELEFIGNDVILLKKKYESPQ